MPGDRRNEAALATRGATGEARATDERAETIMVVDADADLLALLREWLGSCGFSVIDEITRDDDARNIDLIVVDVPFPRKGGLDVLTRLRAEYPGVPVLALSSHFFGGTESNGALAQALAVARVLPKPVTRELMVGTIERLLASRAMRSDSR